MTRKTIASLPEDSRGIVRLVRNLALGLVAALLLLGAAVVGTYLRGENTRDIVERSACAKDPAGRECAQIRAATALHEPIRNSCIPYQRVTSRRGRNCPKFYVDPGPMGAAGGGSESTPGPSLDPGHGEGTGSTPTAQPNGSAEDVAPGKGGSNPQPAPGQGDGDDGAAPIVEPPASSPAPVVTQPPSSPAPAPAPSPAPVPPRGAIGEVVTPVVESARETVCTLTPRLCPAPAP